MTRLVCHLTDVNLDTAFFRALASEYDARRFKVMIGSLAPPGELQAALREPETRTFSLDAASRHRYGAATIRLARLLRRERVAVLHAHCFDPTIVGLVAARLARVPFVFTRHHSDHNIRLGKRWHTRIDGWCARRADRVIAVSEATKRIMTEIERVPGDQVVVVFNGITPVAAPSAAEVARLRRDLNVVDRVVCLTVARLHEEKGHAVLFDAVTRLAARFRGLVVLLAGEGPHRQSLEAQARSLGIDATVRFLGRRNDVPALLAMADVVALPSLAESFGFAALEAMALARPVVATTAGGLPEVVIDGETGLTVPPSDPDALAKALGRVLEDADWAARLGRAGQNRARFFTSDRMLRGYEAVYDDLDDRRRTGLSG